MFIKTAIIFCILFASIFQFELIAAEAKQPNVILVITDDQGYGDLSYYGNQTLQTPHLDQLASNSVRLDDFHVDPTCSPTRSALMTGRYSCRTGVWHTVMGRSMLRADEKTMAQYFRENGYRTGIIGKWHLGDNAPYRPQDRGFDDVFIHGGGGVGQTPDYWGNKYFDDTYFDNGSWKPQSGYCTDIFFKRADKFITENRDRPFFLYLTTNAPHGPYLVDEKYSAPFQEKGVPSPLAEFYGMIVNIDENMGRLRARLKELDLEENTLLIFMTDNGTAAGAQKSHGFNAGMRGAKGSEYEGGHRVPCFWYWPDGGLNQSNSVTNMTAHIDLLPTLINLCKLEKTPADALPFDGEDISSLLNNSSAKNDELADRSLFVQSHRIEHPAPYRKSAVLYKDWRFTNGKELFDLKNDPGQKKNIAKQNPKVVAQLKKKYDHWYSDVSERFDEYVRIPLGTEKETPTLLTAHDWHTEIKEIPWNQTKIASDLPGQGKWAVSVEEAGTYQFTLTRRPPGVSHKLEGKSVELTIGEESIEAPLQPGQTEHLFELDLKPGDYFLSADMIRQDGSKQGIYYIQAEKLKR